jgi:hypothetical protein
LGIEVVPDIDWRQPANGVVAHAAPIAHLPAPAAGLPPTTMAVEIYAQQHAGDFAAQDLRAEMLSRGYSPASINSALYSLANKGRLRRVGQGHYALPGNGSLEDKQKTAPARAKGGTKRLSPKAAGEANMAALKAFAETQGGTFTLEELRKAGRTLKGASASLQEGRPTMSGILAGLVKKGRLKKVAGDSWMNPRYWLPEALQGKTAQAKTASKTASSKGVRGKGHKPRRPPGSTEDALFGWAKKHGGMVAVGEFRKADERAEGGSIYKWLNDPKYFRRLEPGKYEMVGEPRASGGESAAASA